MGLYRWAGSKERILDQLLSIILARGEQYNNWYVPFFGGGADAIEALTNGLASGYWFNDILGDIMAVIMTLVYYEDDLLRNISEFDAKSIEEQRVIFLALRKEPNIILKPFGQFAIAVPSKAELIPTAFRFLVLQSCGYRGVWRVNKSGKYNVPFNRKASFDLEYLRNAARLIRKRRPILTNGDFAHCISRASRGDLVYADPPYIGTHSAYSNAGFTYADHSRLYKALWEAARRGARCWVSGSDHPDTRYIYNDCRHSGEVHKIEVRRSMSRKSQALKESKIHKELLIRIAA